MPSLEFTLMVGCPLRCTFCPQDTLREAYGKAVKYFTLDNFRTVLAKVPKHVRIDFAGMAEPWANPNATTMLGEALDAGYNMAIYTTLYGMTESDGIRVAAALHRHARQIEVLCLHLPDANGNMKGWKNSPAYEANLGRFLSLQGFLPHVEAMTMDGSGRVHPDIAHIGIQLGNWSGNTRAGNVAPGRDLGAPLIDAAKHETVVMCSFTPFYDQNVVLPNGDVVLCCMDYSAQHRIGNLIEQDYYDLFSGPEMGRLRAENMRPQFSKASLCKSCNRAHPLRVGPAGRLFWQG